MMNYLLPYEHRIYSQHGEDGIISQMISNILEPNKFVFEIGWGDGTQNMSRSLIDQGWSGIGIDGVQHPNPTIDFPDCFEFRSMMLNLDLLPLAFDGVPRNMDFFSLDIDSFDFEIVEWMVMNGYRPKTMCLEFNHRFGTAAEASFPYVSMSDGRKKRIYSKTFFHGVSLQKYRKFWLSQGYRYFGFDSSCVNVFFYDPDQVRSLDHLSINNDICLCNQDDKVRQEISANDFWAPYLDKIYNNN